MVLVYKDMQISTLEDIQKLKVKDLREILRSNSEATGGIVCFMGHVKSLYYTK